MQCLQFVLPVTWSYGLKHGITLTQLSKWWSERPAKLAGQDQKVPLIFKLMSNFTQKHDKLETLQVHNTL